MQKLQTYVAVFLTALILGISTHPAPALAAGLDAPSDPVVAVGPNNSGLFLSWKIDDSKLYSSTTVTKIDGSLDGIVWTPLAKQPWWKTTLAITKLADSWKYFSIALADGWAESDWTDPIDSTIQKKFFTTAQSLQRRSFKAQVVPQGYLFGWAQPEDQSGSESPINTVQYAQISVSKGKATLTANGLASTNMLLVKSTVKPNESISGSATFVYRNGYVEKFPIKLRAPKVLPKLLTTKIDFNFMQYDKVEEKLLTAGSRSTVTLVIQSSIKEPLITCNVGLTSGTVSTRLNSRGTGNLTFPTNELTPGSGFYEMPIQCSNPRIKGAVTVTFTNPRPSCDCWPLTSFLEFFVSKN